MNRRNFMKTTILAGITPKWLSAIMAVKDRKPIVNSISCPELAEWAKEFDGSVIDIEPQSLCYKPGDGRMWFEGTLDFKGKTVLRPVIKKTFTS